MNGIVGKILVLCSGDYPHISRAVVLDKIITSHIYGGFAYVQSKYLCQDDSGAIHLVNPKSIIKIEDERNGKL